MFFLFLFNLKPTKLFNTQKEAISYGKEIAKNQNSELVIHNKHSKIHEVVYIQLLILRLLSDSTSRWTPLSFANSLPLSCSIRDFHPQVVAHAGHTKNKKKPNWLLFLHHLHYYHADRTIVGNALDFLIGNPNEAAKGAFVGQIPEIAPIVAVLLFEKLGTHNLTCVP